MRPVLKDNERPNLIRPHIFDCSLTNNKIIALTPNHYIEVRQLWESTYAYKVYKVCAVFYGKTYKSMIVSEPILPSIIIFWMRRYAKTTKC